MQYDKGEGLHLRVFGFTLFYRVRSRTFVTIPKALLRSRNKWGSKRGVKRRQHSHLTALLMQPASFDLVRSRCRQRSGLPKHRFLASIRQIDAGYGSPKRTTGRGDFATANLPFQSCDIEAAFGIEQKSRVRKHRSLVSIRNRKQTQSLQKRSPICVPISTKLNRMRSLLPLGVTEKLAHCL